MGFVKAVKPYGLLITIVVSESNDIQTMYLNVQADFASIPFIDKSIQRSLNARVDAIADWFTRSYNESK